VEGDRLRRIAVVLARAEGGANRSRGAVRREVRPFTPRIAWAAVAVLALAGPALGATPSQIVARLNAQRVANGIPGGIALDAKQTQGCKDHVRYEERNGIGFTHVEDKGKPGYTTAGMLAAATSIVADTGSWDSGNPFENLPLHMAYLLAPRLARVGAFEDGARSCLAVSFGLSRQFAANAVFTYPGNGRAGVPAAQTVHGETPFAPGDLAGVPQGRTSGPTIYLFGVGPSFGAASVTQARLTGPHGPVAIRIVDTQRYPQLTVYVPLGVAFLIPVAPLAAGSYSATATLRGANDNKKVTKTWRFRVG
jgi:hypothetical protein